MFWRLLRFKLLLLFLSWLLICLPCVWVFVCYCLRLHCCASKSVNTEVVCVRERERVCAREMGQGHSSQPASRAEIHRPLRVWIFCLRNMRKFQLKSVNKFSIFKRRIVIQFQKEITPISRCIDLQATGQKSRLTRSGEGANRSSDGINNINNK